MKGNGFVYKDWQKRGMCFPKVKYLVAPEWKRKKEIGKNINGYIYIESCSRFVERILFIVRSRLIEVNRIIYEFLKCALQYTHKKPRV